MEEKSVALVIFGLVAVVAVIGLVLVSSGESTGRVAGTGGQKVYSGGAQQAGYAQERLTDRFTVTNADTLNQPTGDQNQGFRPEELRRNPLPLLEGNCESHGMVSIESPREAESRGLDCPAMASGGELCCRWESRLN